MRGSRAGDCQTHGAHICRTHFDQPHDPNNICAFLKMHTDIRIDIYLFCAMGWAHVAGNMSRQRSRKCRRAAMVFGSTGNTLICMLAGSSFLRPSLRRLGMAGRHLGHSESSIYSAHFGAQRKAGARTQRAQQHGEWVWSALSRAAPAHPRGAQIAEPIGGEKNAPRREE